jgi:hypothetical protein
MEDAPLRITSSEQPSSQHSRGVEHRRRKGRTTPTLNSAMYEDSWYNAFVPRASKPADKTKHRRRESLLKQPTVSQPALQCTRVRPAILILDCAGQPG